MQPGIRCLGIVGVFLLAGCGPRPTPTIPPARTIPPPPATAPLPSATARGDDLSLVVEPVELNAPFPVAMSFAPDGRLFYLSRTRGAVLVRSLETDAEGHFPTATTVLTGLPVPVGAGDGPLSMALSPDFEDDGYLYVYYTDTTANGEPQRVPIVRYTLGPDGVATDETVIVDDLPVNTFQRFHFGGGLSFGPDGKLYLIYGDADNAPDAHDPQVAAGSVLRYNPDGSIPDDNPFPGSPVYSYGHRNGFGLAWHPESGALYESENGQTCDDELNLIQPGQDYGWGTFPARECPYPDGSATPPLYEWTPNVAPTGLTFYTGDVIPEFDGALLMCAYNTGHLFRIELEVGGEQVARAQEILITGVGLYCQLDVVQGPDGWLYTSTESAIYRIGRDN